MRIWSCALALAVAPAHAGEYVGSKSCAPCHAAQYESFQKTPMGRSLAVPEFNKPAQFFHPKTEGAWIQSENRRSSTGAADAPSRLVEHKTDVPALELLKEDGLHMNDDGYKIWNEIVGAVLRKQ